MNKKWILFVLSVLLLFCFLGSSIAEEKIGNARKGKYLFRKSCHACHRDGGKAHELGPYLKKMKEWEAVFAKDKYKEYPCKAQWEKLSEQDLLDILVYLRAGASDSKVPRGCG
jgi:mono/diheme cytochrome c family protein